ncbi:tyrosine-type recombinase/integrase [Peptostreptococcus porci]|uniref:tyrosine-type recombinase/integrase n=1 Tax=Peptostreptococcus porci TaxID=2652282 RepID=UPI0023F56AD5|nr:site-specific integrase [Peptostreptococcus porci]MDD7183227.1 site-specific integrase [Peptostreptococcus porci]MDY5964681.1 site-specific integrase [Peptostreptococcus porci]
MWIENTSTGKFKFCERYKDPLTGKLKKVSITFEKNNKQTKLLAIKELEKKILEAQSKSDYSKMTLHGLIELYLQDCKNWQKRSTYNKRKIDMVRIERKLDSDILISNLDARTLKDKMKKLSDIDQKFTKILFNWSYQEGYTDFIPLKNKTAKNLKKSEDEEKLYFEQEEIEEIINVLNSKNTYINLLAALIVEFLTLTGLRIGELLVLTENDIQYFDIGGEISINKRYYRGDIDIPKSKTSTRVIGVNKRTIDIIKESKNLQRTFGIKSDLLFPSTCGKICSHHSLLSVFKRNKLPTKIHIYRHTHASILAEMGIPLDEIQRRLGHESSDITKRIYIHTTENMRLKESEKFRELEIL